MNATASLRITGNLLTEALSSALAQKPVPAVRKVCSMHSEGSTWIIAGIGDQYYRVRPRMFDLLMSGRTPESLELEPYEPDENGDSDDFYPADDRTCSAADRSYQIARENS